MAEFDRLRRKLGFSNEPAPLIDARYSVEQTLGRGAMGEVHLAHDRRLERQVALKVVRASSTVDPAMLQARLEREALALARVDHQNVIKIHDVGSHAGQTYFTMQFVPGPTLREWQREPTRGRAELLDAYLQAARGLAAAHAVGVVHRDFKPDNVIVGADGLVRVLDFGIAAALRTELSPVAALERSREFEPTLTQAPTRADQAAGATLDAGRSTSTLDTARAQLPQMTRAGTLLGTLPYMSSEQLEGRSADARSDQFGFCVAMWEALTGARPFEGRTVSSLQAGMKAGPSGAEALPRWLRPLLIRGLAGDPGDRWPSMNALIDALERGRGRGRRLALGLGLGSSLAAALVLGRVLSPAPELPPAETCEDFIAQLDRAWGPTQRRAFSVHAGVDPTATAYAIATLDELAAAWKLAAAATCEGEAAPATHATARACLDAWRERLGAHVELLVERGDAKSLARAPDLLARLVPPSSAQGRDYCAFRPSQPVDPEVWRLGEQARASVLLGDIDGAFTLADAALTRARGMDSRSFTAELAVGHASRAEVAAFAGDADAAIAELARAELHALGTEFIDVLLPAWTLRAKLLAFGEGSDAADDALAQVERAEPLAFALELATTDPRRAELLEARGMSERARGQHAAAIALHHQAKAIFIAAGQPTMALKSLINIGANYQDLDELAHARQAYSQAVAVVDQAGLPPSYRNRIQLERDLGLIAYASEDPSELREGLQHFEFIVAHGTEAERLDALELLVAIALELEDTPLTLAWTERALTALNERTDASVADTVRIQRVAGIALAIAGDPRGETLLLAAERGAEALSLTVQFNLQRSWIEWLERVERCHSAHARRDALEDRMRAAEDELLATYQAWRDAGPTSACASDPARAPQHDNP
ncbi:Serine/threonine-protein kinase StkP [Enhygromyxa salina]|uniref:Serine/threonine-protein kinase StkP n=2 Tax=Enhygromyxa salina TaxID=215803 RepID=A0A2S9YRZ0_9BACT|nr:Serine/threonine-protein kinase StkP [Enhygromyxa salina]